MAPIFPLSFSSFGKGRENTSLFGVGADKTWGEKLKLRYKVWKKQGQILKKVKDGMKVLI